MVAIAYINDEPTRCVQHLAALTKTGVIRMAHTAIPELKSDFKFDKRTIDITGKKFGRLSVISYSHTEKRFLYWNCLCDCGKLKIAKGNSLRMGNTRSCGCYRTELASALAPARNKKNAKHGLCETKEYRIWAAMLYRCNSSKCKDFRYYGGRGISVCEEWKDFRNFIRDMGMRPSKDLSIDRINNDGNYEPCNCRWATKTEQRANQRKL